MQDKITINPFDPDSIDEAIKKLEKPHLAISHNALIEKKRKEKRMVFFLVKKCMIKIHTVMLVPIEVAKEAPNIPILNTKINK